MGDGATTRAKLGSAVARVFIVSINYAPEPSGFAPHATQIAEYFARQGHTVSVFTGFPFAPSWRRRPEDHGRLFALERNGNLTVRRVTHYIPRRPSSVVQRMTMEGSFGLAALAAIVAAMLGAAGRPDAVLYIGAQPAVAMLARIVAGLARCPYVVMITDLAARAALDVGMIGGRLSRLLERFEFAAYRQPPVPLSFANPLSGHSCNIAFLQIGSGSSPVQSTSNSSTLSHAPAPFGRDTRFLRTRFWSCTRAAWG